MDGIRCCLLMPGGTNTPILQAKAIPPSAEQLANLLQPEDLGSLVRYIAEAPAHVCFNEIVIAPTKNPTIAI